ncbi:type I-E CRISPR-associated protein Cas5/CasD [Psychromicrobium xiongbiense]|uniref:type I-E CRISPR-associated protein Cas5/CasD n=1 Tax=Psychromicrobium xiongbiense TaxID=3051184 RepID=UPI0025558717|nr:type I-E CRISPR-associated protein Cas5/CasD [Psychromicrobium sp. YIM S02556]
MTVLTFVLKGPLQSWGTSSRFARRGTDQMPSKSGVLGLLAAARGIRRTDPITELLELTFGVRTDQPGRLVRDFQTERTLDGKVSMPLSERYYLGDAVFLAGIESDNTELLRGLEYALKNPEFPLYLGRRSCPPAMPFRPEIREGSLAEVLEAEPWQAAGWYQRNLRAPSVTLEITVDVEPGTPRSVEVRDVPLSFDPQNRQYLWRSVKTYRVSRANQAYAPDTSDDSAARDGLLQHDPMAALSGGI